jgi:hypothetical protein
MQTIALLNQQWSLSVSKTGEQLHFQREPVWKARAFRFLCSARTANLAGQLGRWEHPMIAQFTKSLGSRASAAPAALRGISRTK